MEVADGHGPSQEFRVLVQGIKFLPPNDSPRAGSRWPNIQASGSESLRTGILPTALEMSGWLLCLIAG
ncbi:hypothetical protein F2P79_019068 [Pimephales promelas]|nr:hypothetical protein F2P79_019068 [Pimephales promelas]